MSWPNYTPPRGVHPTLWVSSASGDMVPVRGTDPARGAYGGVQHVRGAGFDGSMDVVQAQDHVAPGVIVRQRHPRSVHGAGDYGDLSGFATTVRDAFAAAYDYVVGAEHPTADQVAADQALLAAQRAQIEAMQRQYQSAPTPNQVPVGTIVGGVAAGLLVVAVVGAMKRRR